MAASLLHGMPIKEVVVAPGGPLTGSMRDSGPSGPVTFLFSDIEGSTERWERDPAAMAAALGAP